MGRRPRHTQSDRKRVSEGIDTRIVQGGRRKDYTGKLVNVPIHRASTILFDDVADMRAAKPVDGTLQYGRNGTPTQWSLAEALTELEPGAAGTKLFPSGAAAVAMALMSVLRPGDELLMVDSVYGPTRAFCDEVLKRMGIATHYYDPLVGTGIADLIGPKTRAVFMESPGSLTFEVQDVPGICTVAKEKGLVTLLDNTWSTPVFFPAIAAGVDISILAATKYVVGHSDAMLGTVTATEPWFMRLHETSRAFGQHVGPDDSYLAARGLRTLGVRLRQHQESALKVARWLAEQPQVDAVLHPAFPQCPGHEYWTRDFRGASGLFSFVLKGGDDAARTRLVDGLEHFGIGYSWGGFESLALPIDPHLLRTATETPRAGPMVRLHIGLEDPDDLIADLAAGLTRYGEAG
ncbi:cystathionine beta-lyase [Sphingosinicella sp. LY1275]|uniref:cystathionine beta-lyase n=1 Tax=Sphingosinicella sp. LY1275 TaxID=3095379 RepID=UPI002ADEE22B|nr:cystathionine beta-lyase [Sphingosinicella sp. LY1275]MEA1015433.1 cystathionine beta-lyase [Sphingosinicella sp. LY1275]